MQQIQGRRTDNWFLQNIIAQTKSVTNWHDAVSNAFSSHPRRIWFCVTDLGEWRWPLGSGLWNPYNCKLCINSSDLKPWDSNIGRNDRRLPTWLPVAITRERKFVPVDGSLITANKHFGCSFPMQFIQRLSATAVIWYDTTCNYTSLRGQHLDCLNLQQHTCSEVNTQGGAHLRFCRAIRTLDTPVGKIIAGKLKGKEHAIY